MKGKYEFPQKIWRRSPTKLEECKQYNNINFLEDFNVLQINNQMLPLIPKSCFDQSKFDEALKYLKQKFENDWKEREERFNVEGKDLLKK